MKSKLLALALATTLLLPAVPAVAQEAVVGVDDAEALFHSPDPKLDANKQLVYHVMKDLLEANHWELVNDYLAPGYIQHNPMAPNGAQATADFFSKVLKLPATPIPDKMKTKVVSVTAEGDYVSVAMPAKFKDLRDKSKLYSTTWFDLYRIENGKVIEHWDSMVMDVAAEHAQNLASGLQ